MSWEGLDSNTGSDSPKETSLLCVFVHGFKGTDSTFGSFPERLQNLLTNSAGDKLKVECLVFPAYETKGELRAATDRFVDWLTTTVVHKESSNGTVGGAGSCKVVLCAHSMGGLLIADTVLAVADSRLEKRSPLWPRIIACIAFDTPYYGLHPFVFKNTASKAVSYAQMAHQLGTGLGLFGSAAAQATSSSASTSKSPEPLTVARTSEPSQSAAPAAKKEGWAKWGPAAMYGLGGAVAAGAAVGAAYYRKDDLSSGVGWAGDHLKYVGNLWDDKALKFRVDSLLAVQAESGVVFQNFYTYLPPNKQHLTARTFINVPPQSVPARAHHTPNPNTVAADEVEAHTGMFGAATNDGFYDLGLKTARYIHQALDNVKIAEDGESRTSLGNVFTDESEEGDKNDTNVTESLI